MRLLTFLVFVRYGLTCKYGKIFQVSVYNWMQTCISDTWRKNCESYKAIRETWFNLLSK